jgi:anti-anti-sigma factor
MRWAEMGRQPRRTETVFLRGDFDLSRGQTILISIRRALERPGVSAVDLADTTFVDAYSIGLVVKARREAAARGVDLYLIHADDPMVRWILDFCGVRKP